MAEKARDVSQSQKKKMFQEKSNYVGQELN